MSYSVVKGFREKLWVRPTPGWNQCESVKAFLSGYELWGG
nr:MAG TPA: hypothetical protein [Caudoviricetes sp.]